MVVEAQVTSSGGGAESPAEPFEDCTPAPEPADPVGAQEDAIRRHQGTLASAVSACREVLGQRGHLRRRGGDLPPGRRPRPLRPRPRRLHRRQPPSRRAVPRVPVAMMRTPGFCGPYIAAPAINYVL